jgi:RHS repeat-associated protein
MKFTAREQTLNATRCALCIAMRYSYGGTAYANPQASTQIGNGTATTTYAYDNNGNLTSAGNGTATTSYSYDYANRLIAILYNNATTSTYGYDAFGTRVYQISASTSAATTTYPFKFFSIASTTKSSNNFATSTEYMFNGDTLVATVDQAFKNGSATGSPATLYIHPDHLGSTNVVTNASGTAVQTLDYYPYGGLRVSTSTGAIDLARKYIGQFLDPSTLSYLNARYYDSSRGQFLSEDPTFLAVGNPNQLQQLSQADQQKLLSDPQQLNSYSYGRDNPITNKDAQGLWALKFGAAGTIPGWGLSGQMGIQMDLQGVEYYYGAGLAGGGGISFGPQITTADLSHQYSISTGAFAQGGAIASAELSQGMTYYPYSTRKPTPYQDASLGFPAVELAGGVMGTVSGPIYTWNKSGVVNYSLPKPQMVSNLKAPTTQVNNSQNIRPSGSSSGAGSSPSYGQVLSNLRSALLQLNAVLSTYKSNNPR